MVSGRSARVLLWSLPGCSPFESRNLPTRQPFLHDGHSHRPLLHRIHVFGRSAGARGRRPPKASVAAIVARSFAFTRKSRIFDLRLTTKRGAISNVAWRHAAARQEMVRCRHRPVMSASRGEFPIAAKFSPVQMDEGGSDLPLTGGAPAPPVSTGVHLVRGSMITIAPRTFHEGPISPCSTNPPNPTW